MQHSKQTIFFLHIIKILNLSLKELRLIAKNRNINGSKSMPKDELLGIINNITREKRQKESF